MKKIWTLIFGAATLSVGASTLPNDSLAAPTEMTTIDSLARYWYNKQMPVGNDTSFLVHDADSNYIPEFSDSVYIERLAKLPLVMDMSYNKIVRNYIHMYTHKRRDLVENMMGLSDYYFPIFEEILDAQGMPLELKYLPVIESALNPNAVSRVGATGLWQFMYYTGKVYKLEINSFVDERRDPIASSYAAAAFLSDLYAMYHDWILVIAAYNCGPGNVNKAIRRSGGKRNYWDIYYYLPRETRGYVPAFIAATYVMNYADEHNLRAKNAALPVLCDTLVLNEKVHFEQISHFTDLEVSELQRLNPQYRRDIIPAQAKAYTLRLPFDKTLQFIDHQDSILNYKDAVYFNPETLAKAPSYTPYTPAAPDKNHVKLTYVVKSGDNLGYIASWYKVSTSNLRYWNGIRGNTIRGGQKLTIYKHKDLAAKFEGINDMTFAQKQATVGKTVSSSSTKTVAQEVLKEGEYFIYTIRSGDTLWDIAKLYPGVTDTDIMRWNGISNASRISAGQKLKIKKI